MSRSRIALVGAACLSWTGCGTFSDAMCGPIDNRVFYRGVRLDIEAAKQGGSMTLMAADVPFSAVADTVLIPYQAYQQRQRKTTESESAPGQVPDTPHDPGEGSR